MTPLCVETQPSTKDKAELQEFDCHLRESCVHLLGTRLYRQQRVIDFFKLGRAVFVSEQSLINFLECHRVSAHVIGGAVR